MRRLLRQRRGAALVSVLFVLVALLTLSGTAFLSAFLDRAATTNFSAGEDALFAADAGIQHLRALLSPAPDFSRELAWPGGRPPFGSPVWFPGPPRTYRVWVEPGAGGGLRVLSEGSSHGGTRRRLEATLRRAPRLRPDAALTVSESVAEVAIAGELAIVGTDAAGAPLAVGAETRAAAEAWARGSSQSVKVVGATGFDRSVERLRPGADLTIGEPHESDVWGTAEHPAVTDLAARIEGESFATGILIADAPLVVHGSLRVEGLLLAPLGIQVDGSLEVSGALWVAARLSIAESGRVSLAFAPEALDRADPLRPGVLPRQVILGAWREVW